MSKFEKCLLLLSVLFLLTLGTVSYRAVQPLPLAAQSAEPSRRTETQKLDINTATVEELCALPGVGPVIAGRIVASREEAGPFASLEELRRVEGIGEKTLEEIYEYLEED